MEQATIYYLDDDQDDIEMFIDATEKLENVQVIVFTSGDVMLRNMQLKQIDFPNAIFIDLNLPFKNGFAVIEEIRTYNKFKDIPIVVLTTIGHNNIRKSKELGANYFVIKPTSIRKLRSTIEHVLNIDFKSFNPTLEEFLLEDIDLLK